MVSQLDELKANYTQLCDSSATQLQKLEEQLAEEEKRKVKLDGQGEVASDSSVQLCQSELQQQKACLETMLLKYFALNIGLCYGQALSVC